jgi:hypothetical protein
VCFRIVEKGIVGKIVLYGWNNGLKIILAGLIGPGTTIFLHSTMNCKFVFLVLLTI